ncbi:MAG TPA: alpha/beta fold hydrolase [Methylomirabilota bacterium]|nr:alpha/beta fold hydrolase [Methylomirabilota bacterium]
MANPVVFIPALACTADLFADQIRAISRGRTVVLANHRRHASVTHLGETLLGELPPRFVLVGLSMGGYAAFELLRRAPERISALVLMDTTARPDSEEATARRERMIGLVEAGRFNDIAPLTMPTAVAPERADDPDLVAAVRRMVDETGPDAYVRQQRLVIGRPDSRPLLPAIACPTLVVVGDRDQITPPEVAEEIASAVPGARLVTMPMCGHLSTLERPQAATHALVQFIDDHGGWRAST